MRETHVYNKRPNLVIYISLESTFLIVKQKILEEVSHHQFDNEELDDIIVKLFEQLLSALFNLMDKSYASMYDQIYQGTLDYLMYCGLSQETAFRMTHLSEMMIMKAVFDSVPMIDCTEYMRAQEFTFTNKADLMVTFQLQNAKTFNSGTNSGYRNILSV